MNKIDYIHKDTKTDEPLITAIELSKENIKFYGNTEEEKKKNEMIYDLTLEVDRLNNIIDKAIEYIKEHIKYECDDTINGMSFYSYHLYDFKKEDLLNILEGDKDGNDFINR